MNDKNILIIASDEDLHADAVVKSLYKRGISVIRIDSEKFLEGISEYQFAISSHTYTPTISFKYKNRYIDISSIKSVYCRDYIPIKCAIESPISHQIRYQESHAAYWGTFRTLEHLYWMNPPWYDDMADNKLYQIYSAKQFGLNIPDSLITNSPALFKDFFLTHNKKVVIKQLSPYSIIDDSEYYTEKNNINIPQVYGFYTELVTEKSLEFINEIKVAPVMFQELIDKKYDIRVTVVGEEIFAVKIDSQKFTESKIDFRLKEHLPIKRFNLPDKVKNQLLKLLKYWHLEFAACDFVIDKNDNIYFIEANVEGNWLWIEFDIELNISDKIAETLINK